MDLPVLKAAQVMAPHGFTTRAGGVSDGAFRTLNVSYTVGDAPAHVDENVRRVLALAGSSSLVTAAQVHGDRVVRVARADADVGEADALWTDVPGLMVGVRVADCVPIILADPLSGAVGVVHSGWRGTIARIAAKAVGELQRADAWSPRAVAAIGPCIRACCYEVSEELAERFVSMFGLSVVQGRGGAPRLDLVACVAQSLAEAGVAPERIEPIGGCTACDARFFSHRRDAGRTGRQLAFAVCRGRW